MKVTGLDPGRNTAIVVVDEFSRIHFAEQVELDGDMVERSRLLGLFRSAAGTSERAGSWSRTSATATPSEPGGAGRGILETQRSLERGEVSLPDDDDLRADLSALRYLFTQDGRIQIENKDEVRRRPGRSPDRADAVALAHWYASTEDQGMSLGLIGGMIVDCNTWEVVGSMSW